MTEPVQGTQSDRIGAMEWAADYAERHKIFEVRNERGYADKQPPPTPAEKANVLLRIATWAMTGQGELPR